jgi:hypothetical protein
MFQAERYITQAQRGHLAVSNTVVKYGYEHYQADRASSLTEVIAHTYHSYHTLGVSTDACMHVKETLIYSLAGSHGLDSLLSPNVLLRII